MKTKLFKSVIAMVMAMILVCGCSQTPSGNDKTQAPVDTTEAPENNNETEKETEPPVEEITLKYIMVGPPGQEDSQMVWDEFNKRLQEKLPGITVEFEIIEGSEYEQKFMLMQTGGEQVDIVGTYWLYPNKEVERGSLIPLEDLIAEYGKEMVEAYPDYMWEYGKVNGVLYQVPAYQQLMTPYAFRVNKALADEYGLDMEKFKTLVQSGDYAGFYDLLEEWFAKLKADDKIGKGAYQVYDLPYHKFEQVYSYMFRVRPEGDGYNAEYYYTMPEAIETFKRMKEWYDAGYIREDILTAKDHSMYSVGTEGGYVIQKAQYNPNNEAAWAKDCYLIPFDAQFMTPSYNAAEGVAISATSKYPEASMKVINLLHSDKELFNLLVYGIEGVHYLKMDENKINVPYNGGMGTSSDKYGLWKWIVGNAELAYDTQDDTEEMRTFAFETVNQSGLVSDFIGFSPDFSLFSDDYSNLGGVTGKYSKMLQYGVYDMTTDELVAEFKDQLKTANLDGIMDEFQKQIDAWMASK